jgi:hypothetical protein
MLLAAAESPSRSPNQAVTDDVARALDDPVQSGQDPMWQATRVETGSLGSVEVPAEYYGGAQTQRSLIHFSIGDDRMPKAVYHPCAALRDARHGTEPEVAFLAWSSSLGRSRS